jgi:hypothetical protein
MIYIAKAVSAGKNVLVENSNCELLMQTLERLFHHRTFAGAP